ncbi:hypothetical protein D3C71_1775150 [compost metagenome]
MTDDRVRDVRAQGDSDLLFQHVSISVTAVVKNTSLPLSFDQAKAEDVAMHPGTRDSDSYGAHAMEVIRVDPEGLENTVEELWEDEHEPMQIARGHISRGSNFDAQ